MNNILTNKISNIETHETWVTINRTLRIMEREIFIAIYSNNWLHRILKSYSFRRLKSVWLPYHNYYAKPCQIQDTQRLNRKARTVSQRLLIIYRTLRTRPDTTMVTYEVSGQWQLQIKVNLERGLTELETGTMC